MTKLPTTHITANKKPIRRFPAGPGSCSALSDPSGDNSDNTAIHTAWRRQCKGHPRAVEHPGHPVHRDHHQLRRPRHHLDRRARAEKAARPVAGGNGLHLFRLRLVVCAGAVAGRLAARPLRFQDHLLFQHLPVVGIYPDDGLLPGNEGASAAPTSKRKPPSSTRRSILPPCCSPPSWAGWCIPTAGRACSM